MKIQVKFTLLLAATFCATAAFAQLTVDEKPNAAPERSFSDTPFPDALKKQIGYITAEMLQGPLGDNMRARTDASNSPVSLDDAYTRRNIRDIPGERIDMRTGALSLSATDLAIPGDGAMPLSFSRTRTDSFFENEYDNLFYERRKGDLVGDWGLNVPYIQLISAGAYDYFIGSLADTFNFQSRCVTKYPERRFCERVRLIFQVHYFQNKPHYWCLRLW
jgi:hypothetical protein